MLRAAVALCFACVAATAALAQGSAAAAKWSIGKEEGWAVVWPSAETKVKYRGVMDIDGAGLGPGAMLYPAPNAAGLLVAILTHAALNEGAKSSQKAALQATADKVLDEYRSILDDFSPQDLMRRTTAELRTAPAFRDPSGARWLLEVQPLFWMSQDRRALIVDNVVSVHTHQTDDVIRRAVVRVVSDPRDSEAVVDHWAGNDGEALKAESARLLAEAIEWSVAEMEGRWDQASGTQRTLRYREGGDERIERAEILERRCARAVIRNLRGELMVVPMASNHATPSSDCDSPRTAPAAAVGVGGSAPR